MIFESVRLSPVLSMGMQSAATVVAELRQEPAQLRVLRKWNSSGKASSDAGPELAGQGKLCGDGKPAGPDVPP